LNRVILRQMEVIGAESEFVSQAATEWLDGKRLPAFDSLPVAVQRRCLQTQLLQLGLNVGFDLIEQLRKVPNHPVCVSPTSMNPQQQLTVQRDTPGTVHILQAAKPNFIQGALKIELKGVEGKVLFENARIRWEMVRVANGTFRAPTRRVNCELFDAAKIGSDIVLRHWQPGDRFQPIGMEKPVKLQDLFTNQKIPRAKRHELLVGATGGGNIFWVEGLRMGARFKLDNNTHYGLKWSWNRL
jgi:tRNA(Ile)-lysidine synthetase-like protein